MAKIDELIKSDVALGVALGIGAAAAAAFLLPAVRPVARTVLKSGILCLEKGRELVAEAGETFEDILAEVKAELAAERLNVESAEQVMEAASEPVKPNA